MVEDLVKGHSVFQNSELDDLIIFRSDGVPTYNFATVLDDADFEITHVVRGDDHLPNTPRQIQIFLALGLTPPAYAHLPMVMGPDGKPLSKRHGATSVFAYRDAGYFPETLLNYLARMGWSHGDQEIFSKQEMIDYFGFDACGKSPGIFNPEKLLWLNFHYLKQRTAGAARARGDAVHRKARLQDSRRHGVAGENGRDAARARQDAGRAGRLRALLPERRYHDRTQSRREVSQARDRRAAQSTGRRNWKNSAECGESAVQAVFERVLAQFGLKLGQLAQPVRVALTGGTVSPGIYEVIAVLGKCAHRGAP